MCSGVAFSFISYMSDFDNHRFIGPCFIKTCVGLASYELIIFTAMLGLIY